MSELFSVSGYRVTDSAAPINLHIDQGAWIGVTAPAEVDTSRFLAECATKAGRKVTATLVDPEGLKGRKTVQQLAKEANADRITRILTALRLWDDRKAPVSSLGERQKRVAALVPALASQADAILIEDWLDSLDPWTITGLMDLLREHPAAKIMASVRPDILIHVDRLIVLSQRGLRFDGAPSDLLKIIRPASIEVETENPGAVAALVEPLQLQIESSPSKLTIKTTEGQRLAAELALRGYPWIKAITVRTATLDEALLTLIR